MIAKTFWLPWRPCSQTRLCSICHILFLLVLNATGVLTDDCRNIPCLHGSPCEERKVSGTLTARCLCPLGWVGSHCQTEFSVSLTTVTMTTVTLVTSTKNQYVINDNNRGRHSLGFEKLYQASPGVRTYLNDENFLNVGQDDKESNSVQYLEYSVQYWSRNQSHLCNILPKTSGNVITVSGLRGNTEYIFCAKTSQNKQCNVDLVNQYSNVSYCVSVRTSPVDKVPFTGVPPLYVILLASGVVVSSVVLLTIITFAIKRRYFCSSTCGQRKHGKGDKRKTYDTNVESLLLRTPSTNRHSSHVPDLESLLLNTPTANQRITINKPSSPGKPEHHLVHKRMRGYAAFAARNEETIALNTVIEYDMPDEDVDVCEEASVNEPTQRLGTFMGDVQEV